MICIPLPPLNCSWDNCILNSILCTTQCTLYTVYTVYTVQWTLYSIQFIVYSVQCTLCTVHSTVSSVQCTLYTVQCTVYSVTARMDGDIEGTENTARSMSNVCMHQQNCTPSTATYTLQGEFFHGFLILHCTTTATAATMQYGLRCEKSRFQRWGLGSRWDHLPAFCVTPTIYSFFLTDVRTKGRKILCLI